MTLHSRRAVRAAATVVGVAALGAGSFSGTAFAAGSSAGPSDDSSAGRSAGPADAYGAGSAKPRGEDYTDGYYDEDMTSGYYDEGMAPGPDGDNFAGLDGDYLDFDMPTRGPSTSVPVKKDDGPSAPMFGGAGHHDHHGANDTYDYDLYQPTEHYDANECGDQGDRHPVFGSEGGFGGFNGSSDGDCDVSDDDYDTDNGFDGDGDDDNGYNGYVGSDKDRQDDNHYLFGVPGS